jgi:hypothetical protein
MVITEEELEMHEGTSHGGMSAVIGLTCQKNQNDVSIGGIRLTN